MGGAVTTIASVSCAANLGRVVVLGSRSFVSGKVFAQRCGVAARSGRRLVYGWHVAVRLSLRLRDGHRTWRHYRRAGRLWQLRRHNIVVMPLAGSYRSPVGPSRQHSRHATCWLLSLACWTVERALEWPEGRGNGGAYPTPNELEGIISGGIKPL